MVNSLYRNRRMGWWHQEGLQVPIIGHRATVYWQLAACSLCVHYLCDVFIHSSWTSWPWIWSSTVFRNVDKCLTVETAEHSTTWNPRLLFSLQVHCRFHNSQPCVCTLTLITAVHISRLSKHVSFAFVNCNKGSWWNDCSCLWSFKPLLRFLRNLVTSLRHYRPLKRRTL